MKPAISLALTRLSELIGGELAATLEASYTGQQVLRFAPLLQSVALEFDRAAARLVEENQALRGLFARALVLLDDPVLAADLRATPQADEDLRVSVLERRNDELRHLLIRLQAWCEARPPAVSGGLAELIWQELRRATERRAMPSDRL